jgi:outer membrane protein assembly factor BamB
VTLRTTICCSALALIALATDVERPPPPPALVPAQPVWTLALNRPLSAPPAFDASRVFFPLEGDRLAAYEVFSGKQLWVVDARTTHQPAAGDDLVFVPDTAAITARRATDGAVAWQFALERALAHRPIAESGWLLGVTDTGSVLALRAADGALVWRSELGVAVHAPPTIAEDRVYVPTGTGRVVALNISDGTVVWERRIGGIPNEALAAGDRLYVGSTDNFFYCLMTKDGRIDWRWRTGADVVERPVADDRRVYFVSLDNVLRGMNRISGAQEWMRPLPIRPTSGALLAGATIVVSGQSAIVRTFDVHDGNPTADINANDEVAAPPRVFAQPITGLPMLLIPTRNIARGAAATLIARSIEPAMVPAAPLANVFKPVLTPVTR